MVLIRLFSLEEICSIWYPDVVKILWLGALDLLRIWDSSRQMFRDVASVIPYNKRHSGFVGVGADTHVR